MPSRAARKRCRRCHCQAGHRPRVGASNRQLSQRSEGRQTEYQRPGFSRSRQCGSAQYQQPRLSTTATGLKPPQTAAIKAAIANLTGALRGANRNGTGVRSGDLFASLEA